MKSLIILSVVFALFFVNTSATRLRDHIDNVKTRRAEPTALVELEEENAPAVVADSFPPPPIALEPYPNPSSISGDKSVDGQLSKAQALLTTLMGQVTREQDWARSVHEIIQNYQFKYTKVLADIQLRRQKVEKLRELVLLLKKARLHKLLEGELVKATEALGTLSNQDATTYDPILKSVEGLKGDLSKLSVQNVGQVVHQANDRLVNVLADDNLTPSQDSVERLVKDAKAAGTTPAVPAASSAPAATSSAPAATPAATSNKL